MLTRPVLLYDGRCGFCLRWVERLRRRDLHGGFDYVAAEARHAAPGLPPIPDAALDRAMHLVLPDGRVLAGGAALTAVLRRLPRWRWVGWLLGLPGFAALTAVGYDWVARRRHRLGGGWGAAACEPPGPTASGPDPAAAASPPGPPSATAG